jgi:hypothetical protein
MSEPIQHDAESLEGAIDLDKILVALDTAPGELPVEAIREARRHRDQIIPRLIAVLQQASAAAGSGKTPEGNGHFFALFLLAEFQAKEALPAIIEAISLPGDLPFDLFGDAVTSVLARVLVLLGGGRHELLDQLLRNRALNEYVRWEAAPGYVLLGGGEGDRHHLCDDQRCASVPACGPLPGKSCPIACPVRSQ